MLIPGRALWPFAVLERAQVNHAVKSGVAAALVQVHAAFCLICRSGSWGAQW